MTAYVVAVINVKDARQYQEYVALAPDVIEKHGGRYLARGDIHAVLEGGLGANRLVILEFPTSEHAKAFYTSAEYQAVSRARMGAADFTMMLVDGVPQRG